MAVLIGSERRRSCEYKYMHYQDVSCTLYPLGSLFGVGALARPSPPKRENLPAPHPARTYAGQQGGWELYLVFGRVLVHEGLRGQSLVRGLPFQWTARG